MQYHSMAERWDFGGETPLFLYTQVILYDGDNYFMTQLHGRFSQLEDLPAINRKGLQKIPPQHLWPPHEQSLQICSDPYRSDIFIKQPRLTGYNGSSSLSLYLLQEARICQLLMQKTNAKIALYLGCVVKHGHVVGLCFHKYAETLADRIRDGRPVDVENCIQQVEEGVGYLHHVDLVHNDIHADNIMFEDQASDALVIIDFDSCVSRGLSLPGKHGEVPDKTYTAEFENDIFALQKLRNELDVQQQFNSPMWTEALPMYLQDVLGAVWKRLDPVVQFLSR